MTKKRVDSSNLNLRFYKKYGWTRKDIEKYLIRGRLMDTEDQFGDTKKEAYFIASPGSLFDMKRLYEEQVKEVARTYNDHPRQSDLEFMEQFNG